MTERYDRYDEPEDERAAQETERRLIRIETRLTRLMRHFGLRTDGTPALHNQPFQPTQYRDE